MIVVRATCRGGVAQVGPLVAAMPEDVDRIHRVWVDAVKNVGSTVHHRDVVAAALDSFEHELQTTHDTAVSRLRKHLKPGT